MEEKSGWTSCEKECDILDTWGWFPALYWERGGGVINYKNEKSGFRHQKTDGGYNIQKE